MGESSARRRLDDFGLGELPEARGRRDGRQDNIRGDGRTELRFQDPGFLEDLVPRMLNKARSLAGKEAPRRIETSLEEMRKSVSLEIGRRRSLAEVNAHIDPEEVSEAKKRMAAIEKAISRAALRLDSLRLIFLGRSPSRF